MYELIKVGENSYYIESPAKIGLYKQNESEVCIIDSGSDKEAGRKVRQLLDANGWRLKKIFNTHSNADHIGGNKYLQGQTGCEIYASGIEQAFTRYPILEPSFLYGGFPPKDLRHKFFVAAESEALLLCGEVLPDGMQSFPLPGHFFDMVGFKTKDNVIYLADCLSSLETLDKYKVSFIYDVSAYLNTLNEVQKMQAELFVPAHAAATEDIIPLAKANISKVFEIAENILTLLREPMTFEELLQKLFGFYSLTMDFSQYALVGSTVRSFLSWLKDDGKVEAGFENARLLWERKL